MWLEQVREWCKGQERQVETDDAGLSTSSELDFILKAQGSHEKCLRYFLGEKPRYGLNCVPPSNSYVDLEMRTLGGN